MAGSNIKRRLVIMVLAATVQDCSNARGGADPSGPARPRVGPVESPKEARATVDPKSSEAAGELVEAFVELLNQHKFAEAYMLLGPGAPPRSEFDSQFSGISELEIVAGSPGDQQGAAGSTFLSVPLRISGEHGGTRIARSAIAIVRRVNDVPGSTEAERRWHIERLHWNG